MAAIIASLVGLLALLVAAYTAYIQRQQVSAQVWPRLLVGPSSEPGHLGVRVWNQGVGPAIVQSVRITVSGEPVSSWADLLQRLRIRPQAKTVVNVLNKNVLTAGQRYQWLQLPSEADVEALQKAWVDQHVQVRICYASTLGQTWMVDVDAYRLAIPSRVSRCPERPPEEQFRN